MKELNPLVVFISSLVAMTDTVTAVLSIGILKEVEQV